jgi:hypothetical protein
MKPGREEDVRMPALTSAEAAVVDHYLAIADYLGRINPTRTDHTHRALLAAQALVAHATALRDALALMFERGETSVHGETLARALSILDAQRRVARIMVADPGPPSAPGGPAG